MNPGSDRKKDLKEIIVVYLLVLVVLKIGVLVFATDFDGLLKDRYSLIILTGKEVP